MGRAYMLLRRVGRDVFPEPASERDAKLCRRGNSATFHGGPVFGGNYQSGGTVLTDAYPYTAETLGRTPSVNVVLPVGGTVAGVATRKTIEWQSTACTYVDISYSSGGTGKQPIVSNYPDVGVYQWVSRPPRRDTITQS